MTQLRVKLLALALGLAACAPVPPERAASLPSPSAPPPRAAETPAKPPTPADTPPPRQEAAVAPLPVLPPRERPDQAIAPERLVGMSEADIERLIGAPAGIREEPPAVVWSYSSMHCGLNVFFYMDMASQTFRALTYELKPSAPGGLSGSACLASLRPAAP